MFRSVEFMHGVEHRHDVFNGCSGLDVMNWVENESAAGREDFATPEDFLAHLFGCSEWQCLLRVDSATPECQAIAVLALQSGGIHAGRGALDRVQNVEPGVNEAIQEPHHATAGVQLGRASC